MWKRIANWLFSASCILFLTDGALGAEVVAREPCDISITGVLQPGDSAVFKRLLTEGGCSFSTLRLDSPGGSLSEALKIAEGIYRTRTVIGDGAECLSACAILFMTGRACSGAPQTCNPLRSMHKNAVLGFHAPFLEASGGDQLVARDVSYSQAAEVFAGILEKLSRISAEVRMTGYDKDIIPLSLLTRMFVTPPQELYLVETNDQLFSWDIGLVEDDAKPGEPALDEGQVRRMCETLVLSEMMGPSNPVGGQAGGGVASGELDDAAGAFHTRSFEPSSLPADFNPGAREYLVSLENFHPLIQVSGWCRVRPDTWSNRPGHFNVSFRGGFGELDPDFEVSEDWTYLPPATLSYDATMHYTMAMPPGTKVRSLSVR